MKNIILFIGLLLISHKFLGQNVEQILSTEEGLKKSMPDSIRLKYIYSLANLYSDVDTVKFSNYLKEGLRIASKNKYWQGMGDYYNIYSVKSLIYQNYRSAERQSDLAARYFLRVKDTGSFLNSKYIQLRSIYEGGKLDNIEKIAKTTLKMIPENRFNVERGKIYSILGVYYRKTDFNQSKWALKKSIECFLASKDYKWLLMPYNNLSRFYNMSGKKDSAIYFAKLAVKYGKLAKPFQDIDYLIAENRLSYLLENNFTREEAVNEIESLSKSAIKLKAKLTQDQGKYTQIILLKIKESQQKFNNTLLAIGLGLIFLLCIFFSIIYFQSKKRQEELSYINQELEFSSYQNQILLKETNHRVKNNFQMILSLLNLHANSPESTNENFIKLSIARITAMAKVHEILHRQEVGQIEVLPYLNEILKLTLDSCFDKNYSLNIHVEPKDLKLNIHTILPLGLMVNEMAINAIKHAFKDLKEGIIEISLNKWNDEYILTFHDNGAGINVETINELSSGIKMIKSLSLQLRGKTEILNENGTKYVIHFSQIGK